MNKIYNFNLNNKCFLTLIFFFNFNYYKNIFNFENIKEIRNKEKKINKIA